MRARSLVIARHAVPKQSRATRAAWIASSAFDLLAMTLQLHRRDVPVAAEVAGAGEYAGRRVAHDALHPADQHLLPRRADVDFVPARAQPLCRCRRDARLD